jgi:hypothetical protein
MSIEASRVVWYVCLQVLSVEKYSLGLAVQCGCTDIEQNDKQLRSE